MANVRDIPEFVEDQVFKRRRLDTGNGMQGEIGHSLDTPKSLQNGQLIEKRNPIVIDLAGSEEESAGASVREPPQSFQISEDEAAVDLRGAPVPGDFTREVTHVQVARPTLTSAAFSGWHPPEELCSELDVLLEARDHGEVKYLELHDFTVYYPQSHRKRSMEMSTLDRLQCAKGVDQLCFTGRLSTATASNYVHGVSFNTLAVDGYGDTESSSLSGKICIQSPWARSYNVWYRLGRPSAQYRAYYRDYMWLATFTKYFIDFLLGQGRDITLHYFRSQFAPWIVRHYGQHAHFQAWHRHCDQQQDFGTAVAAYVNYLFKECYSIDDSEIRLLTHSIWREVDPANLGAIKRQPVDPAGQTVVTSFTFRCFQNMYFTEHLTVKDPTPVIEAQISSRKRDLCLTPWNAAPISRPESGHVRKVNHLDIRLGDVVSINTNPDNQWKLSKSEVWYAYVSSVHKDRSGRTKLDVLWLYEPSDTTLGNAYYPFENELFLSDNCSCAEHAIPSEEGIAKLNVSWFVNDPHAVNGYFVRQKFQTCEVEDSYGFVTLKSKDFSCHDGHLSDYELCRNFYKVGQTVLAQPNGKDDLNILLEPMRIVRFDDGNQKVVLCRFNRTSQNNQTAPPNELLESDEEVTLMPQSIIRTCAIGKFSNRKDVRLPFTRGGLGDHFYVLKDDLAISSQTTLQTPPDSDDDEVSPEAHKSLSAPPLIGLDLYCGGGNFGRGLEEAGIVKMRYAVDWDASALHSYRANTEDPSTTHYYLGSVNDYLHHALRGSTKIEIAGIGAINFASAGSPCPGFSTMQPNKQSEQSLRFASMVASVVAFVDTYSPQYFILENVVTMTSKISVNGQEQNVFSQILASLVALGYQVQQFLGDAWTLGSSQSRSRVFIVASAPGTVPLFPPPCTHGHPPTNKTIKRNLGRTTNGLPFGVRKHESTPFPYISAEASTRDLPDISDSLTQICPRFPDHRTHADQNSITRQRLTRVPIRPRGMGLVRAVRGEHVTSGEAYDWVHNCRGHRAGNNSRSYSRIRPDGLFPTVLTDLHLQCAFNGNVLHWEQHRSLSIMETRRAQGFLDHEVIIGYPSQQLKIVGNSVDRKVAYALGLVMKESWDSTLKLRREMLRGNAFTTEPTPEQQPIDVNEGLTRPSPAQIELVRCESIKMRADAFATILQRLRHNRQEAMDENTQEDAAARPSQRWSGETVAESIAIRRRVVELDTIMYADRGCSP